jgi:hypothetical protein
MEQKCVKFLYCVEEEEERRRRRRRRRRMFCVEEEEGPGVNVPLILLSLFQELCDL